VALAAGSKLTENSVSALFHSSAVQTRTIFHIKVNNTIHSTRVTEKGLFMAMELG
jgi:hypothetical protein